MEVKYVWVVKKNADMTEGRGPMIFDSVWVDDRAKVAEYIDSQPGCMGRRVKFSEQKYGDWTMERVILYRNYRDAKQLTEEQLAQVREQALAKLSNTEKIALGLI